MAYANADDVAARLGRPLTAEETTQVGTLLDDAEIEIKARIPDLADRAEDPAYLLKAVRVEASAVARLMRNPDGYTAETDGNYSYQLNWRLTTGQIEITPGEWRLLGASGEASVLDVRPLTLFERARAAAGLADDVHPFLRGLDMTDPRHAGIGWSKEFES